MAAADRALDDGRVADAVRLAKYVAERSPDGRSFELLGRALLASSATLHGADSLEARRSAAAAYANAAERDPNNAGLLHAAAMVIDGSGDLPKALALYERAVALEPTSTTFRLHRGNARLRADDHAGAAEDSAVLLVQAPDEPWPHALAAEIALARGEAGRAIDEATAASRLAPSESAFRLLHARALRAAGRPRDGVELLLAMDARELASPAIAAELGLSWRALERPDRAAEAWERVQRATPDHLGAAVEAANAWLDAGDRVRASVWIERARLIDANDPRVLALAIRVAEPTVDD